MPAEAAVFLIAFDELRDAYLTGVTWEERAALEARAASLVPGLFLARVDGKSPVEYLSEDEQRDGSGVWAVPLIERPPTALAEVRDAWGREVGVG